ncbi:MAG: alkaline phosphatase D family protein [Pirellulaceae bacterium]
MLRATFLSLVGWLLAICALAADGPFLSNGLKIGEVATDSAIVWTRLTGPRAEGGAVPGKPGSVRLAVSTRADLTDAKEFPAVLAQAESDFTATWKLENLRPATKYYVRLTAHADATGPPTVRLDASFTTAPPPDEWHDLRFAVMSCQGWTDQDDPGGFLIYPSMHKTGASFYVATGDNVYYDNDPPEATTVPLARLHWNRMYGLPLLVEFHRHVPGYWQKDDHDVLRNDAWPKPGQTADPDEPLTGPLTFAKGQRIFREQVPLGEKTYRTFRWGRGVQIWLVEGRDFRSPNNLPDGPEKTIWGPEQLAWLKASLLASDAEFRILISPTPIVGPDREKKADNHANRAFAHEGNAFRAWTKEKKLDNLFVCCGDRHWQYHSVDPASGLHEFAVGAASDQHAGGSPGLDADYQQFHRVKGGFLTAQVSRERGRPTIALRHHDVHGAVVNEHVARRP